MDLHLKNKVIIVTGGDKGIGNGICQLLAEEGAISAIVSRTEKDLHKAKEDIEAKGGKAFYAVAELSDPAQCEKAFNQVIDAYGKVDGLVNNAGVNDGVGLENGNYEDFLTSYKRNTAHYYLLAQLALPYLKQEKGAIVNIGSKVSVTGQGNTSGYAAANGARNALTREWAVELLPYGIRVNAIIVAESYTPQYERWIRSFPDWEERLKAVNKTIPLEQRMTTVEEIANTAVFLLSDRSSHTTGQLLHVDGGYVHLDRVITNRS